MQVATAQELVTSILHDLVRVAVLVQTGVVMAVAVTVSGVAVVRVTLRCLLRCGETG
jgi:hypothetical protein